MGTSAAALHQGGTLSAARLVKVINREGLTKDEWELALHSNDVLWDIIRDSRTNAAKRNASGARTWLSKGGNLTADLALFTVRLWRELPESDVELGKELREVAARQSQRSAPNPADDQPQLTLDEAEVLIDHALRVGGRATALLMLLGQVCIEGPDAPVSRHLDDLIIRVNSHPGLPTKAEVATGVDVNQAAMRGSTHGSQGDWGPSSPPTEEGSLQPAGRNDGVNSLKDHHDQELDSELLEQALAAVAGLLDQARNACARLADSVEQGRPVREEDLAGVRRWNAAIIEITTRIATAADGDVEPELDSLRRAVARLRDQEAAERREKAAAAKLEAASRALAELEEQSARLDQERARLDAQRAQLEVELRQYQTQKGGVQPQQPRASTPTNRDPDVQSAPPRTKDVEDSPVLPLPTHSDADRKQQPPAGAQTRSTPSESSESDQRPGMHTPSVEHAADAVEKTSGPHPRHPEPMDRLAPATDDGESDGRRALEDVVTALLNENKDCQAYWVYQLGLGPDRLGAALRRVAEEGAVPTANDQEALFLDSSHPESREEKLALTVTAVNQLLKSLTSGTPAPPNLPSAISEAAFATHWKHALEVSTKAALTGIRIRSGASNTQATRKGIGLELAKLRRSWKQSPVAVNVWRALLDPDFGYLAQALADLAAWSDGNENPSPQLRSFATASRDELEDEVRKADRRSRKPRRQLAGPPLKTILGRMEAAQKLASRALDLEAAPGTATGLESDLRTAWQQTPDRTASNPAEAMISRLRGAVLSGESPPPPASPDDLLAATLPYVDHRRDTEGYPEFDANLSTLLTAESLGNLQSDLATDYLNQGNLHLARLAGCDEDRLIDAASVWRDKEEAVAEDVRIRLASCQAARLLATSEATEVSQDIESAQQHSPDRFDIGWCELQRIGRYLAQLEDQRREEFERRIHETKVSDPAIKALALDLIRDEGGLVIADDVLSALRNGAALPTAEPPRSHVFREFQAKMAALTADSTFEDALSAMRAPNDASQTTVAKEWTQLRNRIPSDWHAFANAVLPLLGLSPHPTYPATPEAQKGKGIGTRVTLRATPIDGSVVHTLGSNANGHYDGFVIRSKVDRGKSLLNIVPGPEQAPNLVFYPHVATAEMRAEFERASFREGRTALLIDDAVIAHLLSSGTPSHVRTQHITLPHSAFMHYTPDMAGEIPDEVFVGRVEQLKEIKAETGGLFVYGGRQLGKSALLRRAQREFNAGSSEHGERIAIYIDLKSRQIGGARPPSDVWQLVKEELLAAKVVSTSMTRPETIRDAIKKWLMDPAHPQRRILLLLDESDLFLDREATVTSSTASSSALPNVEMLKSLMVDTQRRFKVVYSGLHQVQRFTSIPNSPFAHGGDPILIGPLDYEAAFNLVATPMQALGFEFTSQAAVWKLLAFTNYQAGLIQIVCRALHLHMLNKRSRLPVDSNQYPTSIGPDDVDRVIHDKKVRRQVVSRFQWTVALDPRYEVIAYTLALANLTSAPRMAEGELLRECASVWEDVFAPMRLSEFQRFLDELVGLGVLDRSSGQVGLRSPNVITMLGGEDEILQHLDSEFDLPIGYDPVSSRRQFTLGRRRVQSPLTEHQLARLLPDVSASPNADPAVVFIVGSPATQVELVPPAIVSAAEGRPVAAEEVHPAQVSDYLTRPIKNRREHMPVLVLKETSGPNVAALQLLTEAVVSDGLRACVVLHPRALSLLTPNTEAVVTCRKIREDGLRSWEHPLSPSMLATRLIEATQGWPKLVAQAVSEASERSPEDVLADLETLPNDSEKSRQFIHDCGLPSPGQDKTVDELMRWLPEDFSLEDLAQGVPQCEDWLHRLRLLDVVDVVDGIATLDMLVRRCWLSLVR